MSCCKLNLALTCIFLTAIFAAGSSGAQAADLTVSAVVGSSYRPGQTGVQIPVTVNRSGTALTAGTFVNAGLYWSTNATWDTGDIPLWGANQTTPDYPNATLNSAGTKTVTATINMPNVAPGTYYLIAYVDPPYTGAPNGYHAETNEGNNTAVYTVTVTGLPDLTGSAVVGSSYLSGQAGVQIPVTVIRSGGSLTAGTFVSAGLYWSTNATWDSSDTPLWTANQTTPDFANTTLNSAGMKTVTATVSIPTVAPGTYYLIAYIDPPYAGAPNGYHAETNEANNASVYAVTITSLPDLTASAAVASSYPSGQASVQIPVTVNRSGGSLTAGTFVNAGLYWSTNATWDSSDTALWTANQTTPDFANTTLNSAGTKTVTATVGIPTVAPGTYYLIAYVDPPYAGTPNGYHAESNEGNNTAVYAVTVASLPDLTASTVVGSNFRPGQTGVQIPVTVNRSGGALTTGTFVNAGLYWSTNSTWDAGDISLWGANQTTPDYPNAALNSAGMKTVTATVNIPSAPPGTYYLIAYVDPPYAGAPNGYHAESNEGNNAFASSVTVTALNPVVSSTSGSRGSTLNQPGTGFTPGGTAELHWRRPDGSLSPTLTKAVAADGTYAHAWAVPADAQLGTYHYWAVDLASGVASAETSYLVSSSVNPKVSSTSGPKGSTLNQPGTGFTPGGTAELHWRRPDGSLSPSLTKTVAGDGTYSNTWTVPEDAQLGTYQYWAVDLASGLTSPETGYQVTTGSGEAFFVPLYRVYRYEAGSNTRDHLYTTNPAERRNAVAIYGYTDEGVECYISNRPFSGGTPLYRLYWGANNSHFFTDNPGERDAKIALGYEDEGVAGYVATSPAAAFVAIHRLRQASGTPNHYFLTTKTAEYTAVASAGYVEDRVLGYAQPALARDLLAHGRPQGRAAGVDLGTGAFRGLATTSLVMRGRGPQLAFSHYYNSFDRFELNGYLHTMGPGWSHNFESYVEEDVEGNVALSWGDGTFSTFRKTGSNSTDYSDETGHHDQLKRIDDGVNYGYEVVRKDQSVLGFRRLSVNPPAGVDPSSPTWRRTKIVLKYVGDWTCQTGWSACGNKLTIDHEAAYATPVTATDAVGRQLRFSYDAKRRLTRVEEYADGQVQRGITFGYDDATDTLTSFTDARTKVTGYSYDADGFLDGVTDPNGNRVTVGYDGEKRASSVTAGAGAPNPLTYGISYPAANTARVTDPAGKVVEYLHDAFRLTRQSGPELDPARFEYADSSNPNQPTTVFDREGNATSFLYDARGNTTRVTNALGKVADFNYNPQNRLTSAAEFHTPGVTVTPTLYTYDASGNELQALENPAHETTGFTYVNHQLVSVTDGRSYTTSFHYDARGNLDRVTDPEGKVTQYTNDYAGRTTAVVDAAGKTTTYTFDPLDNPSLVQNALNHVVGLAYNNNGLLDNVSWSNGGVPSVTRYGYDAKNRLETVTDPLTRIQRYTYDASGNLGIRQDRNGASTTYIYDANNWLHQVAYPGNTLTLEHDKNGSITAAAGPEGTSYFTYDELNRLKTYTDPYGKNALYAYDDAGRLRTLTYPGGKIVTYGYDAAGRLKTVADWIGGTTTYTYDASGNLKQIDRPNDTKAVYTYDRASRLVGIREEGPGGTVIGNYAYTLDAVGNITDVDADEPLSYTASPASVSYTHDLASNRLLTAGAASLTYDNNGNRKTRAEGGVTTTYTWDPENRLTRVEDSTGKVVQHRYDALGNRLARAEDGTVTRYVLDLSGEMSQVLAETDAAGNIVAYYVYGLGLVSRITPSDDRRFYHFDNRGDTVALTNSAGATTDAYAYDEYGKVTRGASNATANPFMFVGRYGVMVEPGDAYFMRARFYEAESGRFLSEDPVGFAGGGWNLAEYIGSNPLNCVDATGLYGTKELLGDLIKIANFGAKLVKGYVNGFSSRESPSGSSAIKTVLDGTVVTAEGLAVILMDNRKLVKEIDANGDTWIESLGGYDGAAEYFLGRTGLGGNKAIFKKRYDAIKAYLMKRYPGY